MKASCVETDAHNQALGARGVLESVPSMTEPSRVSLSVSPDQVERFDRVKDDLVVTLINGEKIVIPGFFGIAENARHELLFEDDCGNLWWGEYREVRDHIGFENVKQPRDDDSGFWLLGTGALATAAGGGGTFFRFQVR